MTKMNIGAWLAALCQMACPNDTIKVTGEMIETEDGKKKKILAKYEYDLGSCMFCQLCVNACLTMPSRSTRILSMQCSTARNWS